MKFMIAITLLALAGAPAHAADEAAQPSALDKAKEAVRAGAGAVKDTARAIGHGTRDAAKAVKKGVGEAARGVGDATRKAADEITGKPDDGAK